MENNIWKKDICPNCKVQTVGTYTIHDCSCGIKIRECGTCRRVYEIKELAMCEANSNAVLAEVRAIIENEICLYDNKDIKDETNESHKGFMCGYNSALKDVICKISEHFS